MITALILSAGISLQLPETVEVKGTELTVGSVATLQGEDPALLDRVRAISLGYAPAPGYSRLIDARRLSAELVRALPGVAISVGGAARCRVVPAVRTITAEELYAQAGQELRRVYAEVDARIQALGGLADLQVPEGNENVVLRAKPQSERIQAGTISLPVEIVIDGELYRTVWTRWEVELWEQRYVLRRPVQAGEAISARDLELTRVPLSQGFREPLLDPAAMEGAIARRSLAKGTALRASDLERQVVIRRGDTLSLEVRRGNVTVRTLVEALKDARLGDRLPVRVQRTGKEVTAIVTSSESVELQLQ